MGTYDGLIRDLDKKEKQEADDRQTYPFGTPKRVLDERQEAERQKAEREKKHTDFEKLRWPLTEELEVLEAGITTEAWAKLED